MGWFKNPFAAQARDDGAFYDPSPFTLLMATSTKSDYTPVSYETKYTGTKPILVVCTDEALMEMANGKNFNTGNHPVEMLVPMLHFDQAGFVFDLCTVTGGAVKLEMWAYPDQDKHVVDFLDKIKAQIESPKKIEDISSLDDYAAIFIPGGHGCMINLPKSVPLGKLLRQANEKQVPTVTLCHGPAALLSTAADENTEFAYKDYKTMCFTDKTDAFTPTIGYLPGPMPWKCQATLEEKGMTVLNKGESGAVHQDRELITGDSPKAANNLGKLAAPILVEYANQHKL